MHFDPVNCKMHLQALSMNRDIMHLNQAGDCLSATKYSFQVVACISELDSLVLHEIAIDWHCCSGYI